MTFIIFQIFNCCMYFAFGDALIYFHIYVIWISVSIVYAGFVFSFVYFLRICIFKMFI